LLGELLFFSSLFSLSLVIGFYMLEWWEVTVVHAVALLALASVVLFLRWALSRLLPSPLLDTNADTAAL
jgi:hypothetical protein